MLSNIIGLPSFQNPITDAELWKPEFSTVELSKQVTVVDTSKDHDTILALARVVMLPKDLTDLAEEISDTIWDLLVMQAAAISDRIKEQSTELKRAKSNVGGLESELNKAKLTLGTTNQLKGSERQGIVRSYQASSSSLWPYLRAAELPESLEPYSPMILPGFNEEEYMNQPIEEDGVKAPVNEVA
ncbi:hypothetical protein Acr_00g0073870 [Actinidia rufa]|uniref:Uncharacterized protein n=1 Tax=Actinidia rufa TaxID=165716 RepID=A0A7J0DSD5_9ERIC|nr:hypothetical protein Acr_00g0073870 [Actinidia rufa]